MQDYQRRHVIGGNMKMFNLLDGVDTVLDNSKCPNGNDHKWEYSFKEET